MNKDLLKTWSIHYNKIHALGQFINEAVKRNIIHIDTDLHSDLESEMEYLVKDCGAFLDRHKVRARKTKWAYKKDDESTWPSHENFAFAHLL